MMAGGGRGGLALTLPDGVTLEPGVEYTIRLGWYDLFAEGQPRVPAQVGGAQAPLQCGQTVTMSVAAEVVMSAP